jgi:hypothetical protein
VPHWIALRLHLYRSALISHRSAKIHDRQSSAMVTSGKKISQAWIAFKSQCFLHFAAPLPQTWLG